MSVSYTHLLSKFTFSSCSREDSIEEQPKSGNTKAVISIKKYLAHCDFVQYSYYHVVKTAGLQGQTNLEEDERKSGMHVQWHSL